MENMLDLLDEPMEVMDEPSAAPIRADRGRIEFR